MSVHFCGRIKSKEESKHMCKKILTLAVVAAFGVSALAQTSSFTLTDGPWTYAERAITGATTRTGAGGGSADFTNGTENLFQNWFWYRSTGDTREYALSNQTAFNQPAANVVQLQYTEPNAAGGSLIIDMTYRLTSLSATSAITVIDILITSRGSNDAHLFPYIDYDLAGSTSNSATLQSFSSTGGAMQVTHTSGNFGWFEVQAPGGGLSGWEITSFATTRGKLANATIDNLSNSGSPFGPGDFTGAFQWSMQMGDGQQARLRVIKGINAVPEPGTLLAIGAGLAALAARRRRK